MSAVAINSTLARGVFFYRTTIGKKVVMAVTGLILFGFLIGHMAGNLQFFLGREALNAYAENLHELPGLLWTARIVLLLSVVPAYSRGHPAGESSARGPARQLLQTNSRRFDVRFPHDVLERPHHRVFRDLSPAASDYRNCSPGLPPAAGLRKCGHRVQHPVRDPVLRNRDGAARACTSTTASGACFSRWDSAHPRYTPKIKAFAKLFSIIIC